MFLVLVYEERLTRALGVNRTVKSAIVGVWTGTGMDRDSKRLEIRDQIVHCSDELSLRVSTAS